MTEHAAFSSDVFGNLINAFGNQDILDLRGLHFHAGATATYHKVTHDLTVHGRSVIDTLTLTPSSTLAKALRGRVEVPGARRPPPSERACLAQALLNAGTRNLV
jgi:hypothetical protein